MNLKTVSLLAGFFFATLALFVQGVLPMLEPESNQIKVTKVVRTDLGELKWMEHEATDYSKSELLGREVYIREGCSYCHSQYVRPVTGETRRWGPVTQAGEYAFDRPHLFSTRRIGPDLSRVGLKYSDEWHLAHFWDPRMLIPDSIMPRFAKLFKGPYEVKIVEDSDGNRTLDKNADTGNLFNFSSEEKILITPNETGLAFVVEEGKYPVIHTPNEEFTGSSVSVISQSEELKGLIDYVQKLGTNRGKWRDRFEPQLVEASMVSIPKSEEWIEYGKNVYARRCEGCHGLTGNGNGPAATFMYKFKPRNFNAGVFKFRLTPSGSLPQDGDLYRTVTRGIRGSSMPSWHMLPDKVRIAVIQYIKYELTVDRSDPEEPYHYFVEEPAEAPMYIGMAPEPSEDIVKHGKEVWQQAKCWECHGNSGKGDGDKSRELEDDFGYPILPADLTAGLYKSGPSVKDIYRTVTTGLSGTPMPSYGDSLPEEDRWALAYFVLSLSAFTDSLTGVAMTISQEDRSALNNIELKANTSEKAYKRKSSRGLVGEYAGEAWAGRKGIEMLEPSKNEE
ncbi:MAG: c-type cytochrome [Verrucomicrobiales bacterium]|jgi:cytochrome c oxidase cbb3-type subunit 2|nr:c-type cytochrome [Verrucomicrobiales bacterium]|tara:strand:- start:752 stop:2437 length:1686 start_codon:yes stop_codon:yes gene_type:complete